MVRKSFVHAAVALAFVSSGCNSGTGPSPLFRDFVVSVNGESFVVRTSDPETIRLAEENLLGRNNRFPAGPVQPGDGGFNAPWTWHLDPAGTRLVDTAIGTCSGSPSYVETHRTAFPTYCPWGARVVERR